LIEIQTGIDHAEIVGREVEKEIKVTEIGDETEMAKKIEANAMAEIYERTINVVLVSVDQIKTM
jgi:hypothetical protein